MWNILHWVCPLERFSNLHLLDVIPPLTLLLASPSSDTRGTLIEHHGVTSTLSLWHGQALGPTCVPSDNVLRHGDVRAPPTQEGFITARIRALFFTLAAPLLNLSFLPQDDTLITHANSSRFLSYSDVNFIYFTEIKYSIKNQAWPVFRKYL